MGWLLLVLLPVTVYAVLDLLCRGEPPKALRRPGRALCRLGARLAARPLETLWGGPPARRRAMPVDVFDTFRVQVRLGEVADEILRLESDGSVFARAARLRASRRAYDDLLTEACQLAGDDLGVQAHDSDAARAEAELALASRGWSW